MTETLTGIVLERVRHSDKADIVGVYTRSRGRIALVVPPSRGRAGAMRRAALMPLSIVELQVNFQPGRELHRPLSVTALSRFSELYRSPAKMAVGFFLREFLAALLREYPADESIFDFLADALAALDASTPAETANFHIFFLAALTHPLGVAPDISGHSRPGAYFDMRSASYAVGAPLHRDVLVGEDAQLPAMLHDLTLSEAAAIPLSRDERAHILEAHLRYYAIHFPGLGALHTPDLLRDLFD